MRRAAYAVVCVLYYYSILVGSLPMEYDRKTGRLLATRRVTIYTAVINVGLIAAFPFLYSDHFKTDVRLRSHALHEAVVEVTGGVRLLGAAATYLFNWIKRSEFISIVDEFQHLQADYFRHITFKRSKGLQEHHRKIVEKFIWYFLSEAFIFAAGMYTLHNMLTWTLAIRLALILVLMGILNLVLFHRFLSTLNMNRYFQILNDEMKEILHIISRRTTTVSRLTYKKELRIRLDKLIQAHWRMLKLVERVNRLYAWQSVCISINLCLQCIGMMYFWYAASIRQSPMVKLTPISGTLYILAFVSYLRNLAMNSDLIKIFLHLSAECGLLIKAKWPMEGALDAVLEQNLERFCLQLATMPAEISPLGLTKLDDGFGFRTTVATVTHAILLMLYDYENY